MGTSHPDVTTALASLQARWGAAAPRRLGEVVGSLATAPLPDEPAAGYDLAIAPAPRPGTRSRPDDGRIVPTGFAALDAILGPGGLPHDAAVTLRGDGTSGRTTLALRLAAEAQASGSIVAYLDLARSLDPVEAVARGVRLDWLVVLAPASVDEGLAMAGSLVQARAVDLLLVDLPDGLRLGTASRDEEGGRESTIDARRSRGAKVAERGRGPTVGERLGRLGALARRAGTMLVVLEPPGLPASLHRALDGSTALRLELTRRSWIRLGRDVVGQRTEVVIARSRLGPPGRRAQLRILYADGGDRDACLRRDELLGPVGVPPPSAPARRDAAALARAAGDRPGAILHPPEPSRIHHAPSPSPLVPSSPSARPTTPRLQLVPERSGRAGRRPMGRRAGPRHEPGGARPGRPSRDAARERPPARA